MGLRRFDNQRVVDIDGRALSGELVVSSTDHGDDGHRVPTASVSKGRGSLGPRGRPGHSVDVGRRRARGLSDSGARAASGLQAVVALSRRGSVPSGQGHRVLRVRETDLPQRGSVADPAEANSYRLGQDRPRFVVVVVVATASR